MRCLFQTKLGLIWRSPRPPDMGTGVGYPRGLHGAFPGDAIFAGDFQVIRIHAILWEWCSMKLSTAFPAKSFDSGKVLPFRCGNRVPALFQGAERVRKHDIVGVQQDQQFALCFTSRQIIRDMLALILFAENISACH